MLCNIVTMYLYYKAFEAMKPHSSGSGHHKPERRDDQLSRSSFSSGSSSREERTDETQSQIDLLMSNQSQDRVTVSRDILAAAKKADTQFRYPAICLVKLEHAMEAIGTLMANDPRQEEVRENLLLSLATIKGNHDHQWPTALKFLNQQSSEGTVHAALLVLKNSSPNIFKDFETVKSVLESAERSERCRQAVVQG